MRQHLSEDDPDRRLQFCEWAQNHLSDDPSFAAGNLFSDEANFYVHGEVNWQNMRYWSDSNPHWYEPTNVQGGEKVMVWCGIWDTKIIGPVFIDRNLNAETYLSMLDESVMPLILNEADECPNFFQQDGAPPHYGTRVRDWLDQQFPLKWIGRRDRWSGHHYLQT
jgi:hypothetical protein